MADTVSSGGVSTQGTRTYLFGTSSGIDTAALVEAAYKSRTAEADKIDVKVTRNTAKADAYGQLQTLGKAVQTSLANLKKPYGYSSTTNSYIFDMRSGAVTSNTATDPTKLVSIGIDPGTDISSYEIQIIQKAKANRIGSDLSTNTTTALGLTGSFNLGLAGGASSTINVTSGMSLTDIASTINTSTGTSGVSAAVLKIDETHFQLVLSATSTAKSITFGSVSGTDVLGSIGVTNGAAAKNVLQTADKAIVKLDDVTVTRDTNQIDDLIEGVHITINNADPATTLDVDIQNDSSSLKDAIMSFTEAYNALRTYVIKNQTVSTTGETDPDAFLYGDNILKSMSDTVQGLIAGAYGNGGTALSTMRELGITLDLNNKFVVDETVLDAAIVSHYDEVKNIFTAQVTSDNTNFAVISNTSKQKSLTAALVITANASGVTGVSVGGNSNLFDISGSSIKGKVGTIYEGLSMSYIGTTNATVNLSMKQGFADLINNNIDTYTNSSTGSFQSQISDIGDQNKDMNLRADRIRERADDYREKLIDRYASFESQIARSKSIIAQLKAILGLSEDN